jgi:hypothetical protein
MLVPQPTTRKEREITTNQSLFVIFPPPYGLKGLIFSFPSFIHNLGCRKLGTDITASFLLEGANLECSPSGEPFKSPQSFSRKAGPRRQEITGQAKA